MTKWKNHEFSDVVTLVRDKHSCASSSKNFRCIELEHIGQGSGRLLGFTNSTEQASVKTKFKKGDVLFGKLRPYLRKSWLAQFDGVCSTEIWAFRAVEELCTKEFLSYLVQTHKFVQTTRVSSGSKMPRADWDWVAEFVAALPTLNEQRKIAQILATWDGTIEAVEKLVDAKRKRKRALMQRLLTGKHRLPKFADQPRQPWQIGDLFEPVYRYIEWDEDAEYKLVSIRRRFGGLFVRGDFFGHSIGVKTLKTIRTGDFLISKRQVSHGAWAVVGAEHDGSKVSDEYDCLSIVKPEVLDATFWGWFCKLPRLRHFAYLASNGVHIEKLIFDFNAFRKRTVQLPATRAEQEKIAEILELAEAEIVLLESQLDELRKQKRGLMQQLLTGRIRVEAGKQ